jgi:hypothetical protein
MWMQISIPMLPKCRCYAVHAQKQHFYFKTQGCEQDQKNKFGTEESIGYLIGTKIRGARNVIDHNEHK